MIDPDFVRLWMQCFAAAATGALARNGLKLWGEGDLPPADEAEYRQWRARRRGMVLGDVAALPAIAWVASLWVFEWGLSRPNAELASVICGVFGPAWAIARLLEWVERRLGVKLERESER